MAEASSSASIKGFRKAYRQAIRISKADSAWVYHVLEAHEGIVSYSTRVETEPLLTPEGAPACELELTIPGAFLAELSVVLEHLKQGGAGPGIWIQELGPPALEP